ncbi:MAG: FmdE family protein [Acidobacteria bacterium]|nr:FmdE family protein [Acidobacteriota bacterium]
MLPPLDQLLSECETLHGHICPGQVLGARMAVTGCRLIGVSDPRGADKKNLLVWVEIDRCMTDAISAVTGVRLGRRSLKFFDYGKVAATFLNLETGTAVRLAALESSRALAERLYPNLESKKERQMRTYHSASDNDVFKIESVNVLLKDQDLPGRPRGRVSCSRCGEGINDGREVCAEGGEVLCRVCAFGGYYGTIRQVSP